MIIFNNQKVRFFYSLNKKFYDVICIGNKAEKVAKLVEQQNKKLQLKKLFIKSSNVQFQASLAILGKSEVKISNQVVKDVETCLRNEILKVDPNRNVLILRNGEQLRFKHLIYSGQDQQWKDRNSIKGLKQALQNNYTSTYADIQGSKVEELYNKVNNEIYFNISSDRHFGIDNYFMLHLAEYLKNISQQYGYDPKSTKIKILNKGKSLVPFNSQVDSMVKNLLQQNNVQIVDDCTVQEINHRKRQFKVKVKGDQKTLKYGGFYQYLPFKVPQFLTESQINPLNVDSRTLVNKDYPTIHVIGNIVPSVHSFYGYNFMAHVMARNIINMELKSNNFTVYQGDTAFPFWTGVNSLTYFTFNYEKTTCLNNIGKEKWSSLILGLDKKLMGRKEIQMYFNGKSYGMPYYFTSPKLKSVGKQINSNINDKKQCLNL